MFNMYPYTDFHELNLDWLLRQIMEINATLKNFIVMNTIKYADPFQWNITTQYESNTIVMEPNTGVAYISVQPVPSGVSISNTDFWTPVFDLSLLFSSYSDNLTFNNEAENVTSAHSYAVGSWLIWKNQLYLVTTAITAGDGLNPGGNIELKSVEELVDTISSSLDNVINDISTIQGDITTIQGDVTTLQNDVGGLLNDVPALQNDVNAINTGISNFKIANVRDYGAVGNNIADDTQAFIDALASGKGIVFVPKGAYKITQPLTVPLGVHVTGEAQFDSNIICWNCGCFVINPEFGTVIENLQIIDADSSGVFYSKLHKCIVCNGTGVSPNAVNECKFINLRILGFRVAFDLRYTWSSVIDKCYVALGYIGVQIIGQSVNDVISNSVITCVANTELPGDGTGSASIQILPDSGLTSEGIMINSCTLASGNYGIYSYGTLNLAVSNSIIDLCGINAIYTTGTATKIIGNWIYSTAAAIRIPNFLAAEFLNAIIADNYIRETGSGGYAIAIGDYANSVKIVNNNIIADFGAVYLTGHNTDIKVSGNNIQQNDTGQLPVLNVNASVDNEFSFNTSNAVTAFMNNAAGNDVFQNGTASGKPKIISGNLYADKPAAGTFTKGDVIFFNNASNATGYIGCVCTAAGTPGTWKYFGQIEA